MQLAKKVSNVTLPLGILFFLAKMFTVISRREVNLTDGERMQVHCLLKISETKQMLVKLKREICI